MKILKLLVPALVLGTMLPGTVPTASAQGQTAPTETRQIDPQEFFRLAYSSSSLQAQAARLAADRDTRPEVKSYAAAAADFRKGLLQRLEIFAKERSFPLPSVKKFEHQVILENLEPLDYLALSRRYAEIEIQAIGQEIGIYQAASRSRSAEIKSFAEQVLPELLRQQEGARKMYEAVRP